MRKLLIFLLAIGTALAQQPVYIGDGKDVTLGAKADAKSTATDTTSITIMQVLKQISASVQAPPTQAVTEADGANVTLGAKADAKSTATDTTAITIMQVLKQISASVQAPPSQAVTIASGGVASGAIASGAVASGAVASGAFASGSISDGADVTLGAKADAKSTATDTTSITIMQVLKQISASVQAPPSQAVTNAGTFAVQNTANASTNVTQWNGTTVDTNSGNKSAGTARNVLATDQLALATWGHGATGAAVPSGATYMGGIGSGNLTGIITCDNFAKLDMTTATTTEIVALAASKHIYICQETIMSNGTAVVTRKFGTGTNCGTGTTASGPAWDLTAQTGVSRGSGIGMIAKTGTIANAFCYTSSAAVNVHIEIAYTQMP